VFRRGALALIVCVIFASAGAAAGDETRAAVFPSTDGGTIAGPAPIGCSSRPGRIASRGGGGRRDVALTFDDGPSLVQTPAILATLNRFDARGTFFEEGRHVAGREELMRQIVASGDEIGNHTFDHPHYPGFDELASTDRLIRRATGFEPCLFRPPYGLLDGAVDGAAVANHLQTVLWTFDSGDDHHPPPARIEAHVLADARPGSIILMHDGGRHPQTVRALPGVVEGLENRDFELVTVSALLGGHMVYPREVHPRPEGGGASRNSGTRSASSSAAATADSDLRPVGSRP
jgi:peptidoglycan/xylan/chitin deacetylase (PgdA/CDA1 family)